MQWTRNHFNLNKFQGNNTTPRFFNDSILIMGNVLSQNSFRVTEPPDFSARQSCLRAVCDMAQKRRCISEAINQEKAQLLASIANALLEENNKINVKSSVGLLNKFRKRSKFRHYVCVVREAMLKNCFSYRASPFRGRHI